MQKSYNVNKIMCFSIFPLVATLFVLFPFLLTLSWCPDVEGLRVGDISSTILQGKGFLRGKFILWNHSDGIGLPHPYGTNLIYHPIVLLFALLRFDVAILIFYFCHSVIGAYSVWYLCNYFQIQKDVKSVCVLTYLMSSPSLNYLIGMDFWPTCVVVWTGIPLLLLLMCKFLDSEDELILRKLVAAISALSGLITINSHLGALTYSMMGLSFFALANIRKLLHRWKHSSLILILFAMIVAEKFYTTYSESLRFGDSNHPLIYMPPDIMAMFFWPLKSESIQNLFKGTHYRSFFMGFPFVFMAFAAILSPSRLFPYQRSMAFASVICLTLLFIPPQWIPGHVLFVNYLWRDPLVLLFTILAGKMTSLMFNKKGIIGVCFKGIILIQVITLLLGVWPYWIKGIRRGIDYINRGSAQVLRDYVNKGPTIKIIEKYGIEPGQRIVLSEAVQKKLRYYSKIDYTLFRIHELPLINGIFKGIDYSEVSPNLTYMYGAIDVRPFSTDKDLLDVMGVKYLIAFDYEAVHKNLQPIETIHTEKGDVIVYNNPDPWQMANIISSDLFEDISASESIPKHLVYRDFMTLKKYLIQGKIGKIKRSDNRYDIQFNCSADRSLLFVNSYFRPSWKAIASVYDKKVQLKTHSVFGGFIGVDVPPGTQNVTLIYRPLVKIVLICISLTTLLACILMFLLCQMKKYYYSKA